jgi:hypothetical protein
MLAATSPYVAYSTWQKTETGRFDYMPRLPPVRGWFLISLQIEELPQLETDVAPVTVSLHSWQLSHSFQRRRALGRGPGRCEKKLPDLARFSKTCVPAPMTSNPCIAYSEGWKVALESTSE